MKILVICQYYKPEPFRISDICEKLVLRGHEVDVVTALPNYPMGEIYPGYDSPDKREEVVCGVKVHRVAARPRKKGAINRFLNYYSFASKATKYVKKMKEKFDVIFVNQLSPVMMAKAAIQAKKTNKNAPLVLYCLDLWPESLVAGGIKRGSLIYKYYRGVSKKIYSRADKILVTSSSFEKYFEDTFGIKGAEYLPQYAESLFEPEKCKKTPDGKCDVMFAGNIGSMQSVDTIIKAASLTKERKDIVYHIVGDGKEIESMKSLAKEIAPENVIFYGRRDVGEMPAFYAKADAMLVTMKADEMVSYTLPGKVQSYLAAGKPVIGAIDGEAAKVILESGCGLCGKAEDEKALAENIIAFADSDKKGEYALAAEKYYEENFTEDKFMDKLCIALGEKE